MYLEVGGAGQAHRLLRKRRASFDAWRKRRSALRAIYHSEVDPPASIGLLRPRGAHAHARVTNIELFFDRVFVFAVTQLSHTLHDGRAALEHIVHHSADLFRVEPLAQRCRADNVQDQDADLLQRLSSHG